MSHHSIPGQINHNHLSDARENDARFEAMAKFYDDEPIVERQHRELEFIRNSLVRDIRNAFRAADAWKNGF